MSQPQNLMTDAILDALPEPILVTGPARKIIYVNRAAEEFFHGGLNSLAKQGVEALVGFSSPILAALDSVARTGMATNEYDITIQTPRFAEPKLIDVQVRPFEGAGADLVLVLKERTAAERIERQLAHRGAARSVSGLSSVLAHEIKNPLAGIRGAAQLIEQMAEPDVRELTQLICAETDRIRRLVEGFEEFGDERPITKTPVNIHDVLDRVVKVVGASSPGGKPVLGRIRIVDRYDPSLPDVPGDLDRLVQALLNLVKNAVDAIGPERTDGRVQIQTSYRTGIRVAERNSSVRHSLPLVVAIEDNGPGIPPEIKPFVFEPFITTKPEGKGLGLALVAKIIGEHGGIIECESEPGRTIFRMHLPVVDDKALRRSGKKAKEEV